MINALPFFPGLLGGPIQGNGQTGGIGLDQPKPAGHPCDNPFANILRDQSAVASPLNGSSNTTPGNNQGRGSNSELPLGTQTGTRDSLLSLYLAKILAVNEQRVPTEDAGQRVISGTDAVEPASISLTAAGKNDSGEVGQAESQKVLIDFLLGNVSQAGPVVEAIVSPQALLAGKPEGERGQVTTTWYQPNVPVYDATLSPQALFQGIPGGETGPTAAIGTQTGLPFFTGSSSNQTASVESTLVEQNTTPLVTKVDSQLVLRNAVGSVVGEVVLEPDANHVNIGDRGSSPVQDTEVRLPRNATSPMEALQGPLKAAGSAVNQAFQAPIPFEETPAGIADAVQSSQNRLKDVSGLSSALRESSANGKESSIAMPLDLPENAKVSLTGDRARDVLEVTGKAEGVDPNAGQGLNNGMGGSPHSQSGFQQSSSSLSPGSGVRMAEERGPELPTPALQRLQMDVQLSETNRIQIDVGVQQRQVYAGLLMDQATLKNLAVQFVPQLEEQLAQSDMDLQEFSAEVRDYYPEQESATDPDWRPSQQGHRGSATFSHAQDPHIPSVTRFEERGWHYVA